MYLYFSYCITLQFCILKETYPTNASKAGNAVFESINLYIYLFFRNKRFISNNFVCASKVRVLSFTELLDGGGAIRNGKREWKGKKTEKKGL